MFPCGEGHGLPDKPRVTSACAAVQQPTMHVVPMLPQTEANPAVRWQPAQQDAADR
jgi:hypothetical protein